MKRRHAFGRKIRSFARRAKSYGKRKSIMGGSSGADLLQFDAMAYGAVRPAIAGTIGNLIPIQHDLKDEVIMGLVDWGVSKYVGGFAGSMARKGLVVENARVGEYFGAPIVNSVFGQVMGSSSSSTGLVVGAY